MPIPEEWSLPTSNQQASSSEPQPNLQSHQAYVYNMQLAKRLFRVGYDEYTTSERHFLPEYRPIYTEDVLRIEKFLKEKYPELFYRQFKGRQNIYQK